MILSPARCFVKIERVGCVGGDKKEDLNEGGTGRGGDRDITYQSRRVYTEKGRNCRGMMGFCCMQKEYE